MKRRNFIASAICSAFAAVLGFRPKIEATLPAPVPIAKIERQPKTWFLFQKDRIQECTGGFRDKNWSIESEYFSSGNHAYQPTPISHAADLRQREDILSSLPKYAWKEKTKEQIDEYYRTQWKSQS